MARDQTWVISSLYAASQGWPRPLSGRTRGLLEVANSYN